MLFVRERRRTRRISRAMRERPKGIESLSVSTFQLRSVQAAAVAELLRIAPVADRLYAAVFS